jgi:cytochrome P450
MANVSPFVVTFPPSAIAFTICILGLWLVYRWILPRPLPGIPYNKDAANSILGDMTMLIKHARETGEIWSWISLQTVKLNSPIVQVFTRPFSKPWVIVTDFRESQDILMRRTKEFDRSVHFENIFSGVTPDHHIIMKSTHPEFKTHRRLIQDLMTPTFLNDVRANLSWVIELADDFSANNIRFRHREFMPHLRPLLNFGLKRRD